jgi:hypothetical protein
MKKWTLIILTHIAVILLSAWVCLAKDYVDVLIYANLRTLNTYHAAVLDQFGNVATPEVPDETYKHWSGKVLDLGPLDEIIMDYYVVATSADKVMAHCRVEVSQESKKIRDYIDAHPELGVKYWMSYKDLWQNDRTIAKRALRYLVQKTEGNLTYMTLVSVLEAEQLGITIIPANILVPHQWAGCTVE